jgi:hypothetical protein
MGGDTRLIFQGTCHIRISILLIFSLTYAQNPLFRLGAQFPDLPILNEIIPLGPPAASLPKAKVRVDVDGDLS